MFFHEHVHVADLEGSLNLMLSSKQNFSQKTEVNNNNKVIL